MATSKIGHTSVRQGKRVLVHLKDGTKKVGKFYEDKSKIVKFYDIDPIKKSELRTLTIYKGKS